eukprot:8796839-Karenia_brevis.AAC.1
MSPEVVADCLCSAAKLLEADAAAETASSVCESVSHRSTRRITCTDWIACPWALFSLSFFL